MQSQSVQEIAFEVLPGFDETLIGYIIAVIEEMSQDERQNSDVMAEAVAPFIIDSEYASEQDAQKLCKKMVVAFGGSGYKSGYFYILLNSFREAI